MRGSDSMMEPVCRAFPHTLHKHTDINSIPTSNGLGEQLVELGVGFQESKHSTSELKQDRGHSEGNKEGGKVLHWTCGCTPKPSNNPAVDSEIQKCWITAAVGHTVLAHNSGNCSQSFWRKWNWKALEWVLLGTASRPGRRKRDSQTGLKMFITAAKWPIERVCYSSMEKKTMQWGIGVLLEQIPKLHKTETNVSDLLERRPLLDSLFNCNIKNAGNMTNSSFLLSL